MRIWEDGLAIVGKSQLRIPKFKPEIMFSNMLPLVSIELEYHDEWWALKSASICRRHEMGSKLTSCARAGWGM